MPWSAAPALSPANARHRQAGRDLPLALSTPAATSPDPAGIVRAPGLGKLVAVKWQLEVLDEQGAPLPGVPLLIAPGGAAPHLPALEPEPSAFATRKARYRARRRT